MIICHSFADSAANNVGISQYDKELQHILYAW